MGTFITPYLLEHHTLRVLDMRPPRHPGVEYIEGSIADPEALRRALDGMDAFISMVMKSGQGGMNSDQTVDQVIDNYTVNCLGVHLLLLTAVEMGIRRGIYTSTMSVHNRNRAWYPSEEETPLDGPNVYGLTKGFGERICRYFAREFDMNLVVLRITGPATREQFVERIKNPPSEFKLYYTDEEDMARAFMAALEYIQIGHGRCETFFISVDVHHEEMNLSKARAILGWKPETREKLGL